jgi:tetratricopeptide (TPR) repeat protein
MLCYSGAIEEFQKSMALESSALGKYHLTQAALFKSIGKTFAAQGKFDRSIKNFRTALLIYHLGLGKEHVDTLSTVKEIGYAAEDRGMSTDEVDNYRDAVSKSVAIEISGNRFLEKGEHEKAVGAFRRAIALEESSLGQFHLCTADLYSKIADALKILKRYDRALVYIEVTSRVMLVEVVGSSPHKPSVFRGAENSYVVSV